MRKTKDLILRNTFHNTFVKLLTYVDDIKTGTIITLSAAQVRAAHNKLCGSKTCQCSGITGARAKWHYVGDKIVEVDILPLHNGVTGKLLGADIIINHEANRDSLTPIKTKDIKKRREVNNEYLLYR